MILSMMKSTSNIAILYFFGTSKIEKPRLMELFNKGLAQGSVVTHDILRGFMAMLVPALSWSHLIFRFFTILFAFFGKIGLHACHIPLSTLAIFCSPDSHSKNSMISLSTSRLFAKINNLAPKLGDYLSPVLKGIFLGQLSYL